MIEIRQSSNADRDAVLAWLKEEYEQSQSGQGFWCNRAIIERAHDDETLLVGVEQENKEVVAFQVGGLLSPGILEVRPDRRGRGYGRQMVKYCVDSARNDDECVLHIDCTPATSIPFWTAMGFRLFSDVFGNRCPTQFRNHAFRVLEKPHSADDETAARRTVGIQFRSECGYVLSEVRLAAAQQVDGRICLPRRIVSYCPYQVFSGSDTFVEITIDSECLCSSKAKYPQAEQCGVERRSGEIFLVDSIVPPNGALDAHAEGMR